MLSGVPDLTCVVVHWNVPQLLADCLASLRSEVEALGARGVAAEIVVVDNASTEEVRAAMRAAAPPGVRYLWQAENEGYPRAANAGFAASTAPFVLISNPDVLYLPGSLAALVAAMADPTVALAAPATWWDRGRTCRLNPGFPENRERLEADHRAKRERAWPGHALAWQRRMAEAIFATEPREWPMPSGACLLVRRTAIAAVGGLFDPALFLYYDDTDLSHRLEAAGARMIVVPQAEIVHLFDQSHRDDVPAHMARSRRHYLDKHYGAAEAERLLRLAAESIPAEAEFAEWRLVDLGELDGPPTIRWQASGDTLLAMGVNPQIVPAALARRPADEPSFSPTFWDQLSRGVYYLRVTDPSSTEVHGYWKFVKR
jgi:N-acetylglucosaminyl-diphospho-decaprenol L-rhamnosyltransferase